MKKTVRFFKRRKNHELEKNSFKVVEIIITAIGERDEQKSIMVVLFRRRRAQEKSRLSSESTDTLWLGRNFHNEIMWHTLTSYNVVARVRAR